MSTLNVTTFISTKFNDNNFVNVFETTELFVMENTEIIKKLDRNVCVDTSDIDWSLKNAFYGHQYKGGFRCFKAAFYRELATYGYIKKEFGLVKA